MFLTELRALRQPINNLDWFCKGSFTRYIGLILILCNGWWVQPILASNRDTGFDIVTMQNGDIHQGTAAVENLSIETSFAVLDVPYHLLHSINATGKPYQAVVKTKLGETLIGQIRTTDLTMLRVLDKTLPLKLTDIATIEFSFRGLKMETVENLVALESLAGSQVLATFSTRDFLLKGEQSMQILKRDEIHSMDIESTDENKQQVQVRLDNGQALIGTLLTDQFRFQTRYSQMAPVSASKIASVVFSPAIVDGKIDFYHRWNKPPENLLQDRMVDGDMAPEMVILNAGTFSRGDASGDTDEQPPTTISLSAFAIGVFEITFAEYDKFCIDIRKDCPDDEGWGRGRRPVVNVSWNDALAYTQWLSGKTRKAFRLPTDAEWEYASRAGSQTIYWWGDQPGLANANCEGCNSPWDGSKSAVVGKFPANPFGLHDSAGNVFEWVSDCWHDSYADAPADGSALEKTDCGKRVIRSGAWSFPEKEARSANRWRDFPSRRSDDTGFRIARDL